VLVGVVTMERLLAAAPATPVTELMDPRPPTVRPGTDQEHAAWQAVQHGESALAAPGRSRPSSRTCRRS
jgi:magnesium transporter